MPPKLPGLYFDEVKGRYFPVKANGGSDSGEREQKKRKIALEREEQARQVKELRRQNYEIEALKSISAMERAFGRSEGSRFLNALEIEARSQRTSFEIGAYHGETPFRCHRGRIAGPVVVEDSLPRALAIATTKGDILFASTSFCGEDMMTTKCYMEGRSWNPQRALTTVVRFNGNILGGTGLYCHMTQEVATLHKFTRIRMKPDPALYIFRDESIDTVHRELGDYGNVFDSANLGSTFVVATGSSLQVCRWNNNSLDDCESFQAFTNGWDIVCLAAQSQDPTLLYAGTRNGWLYAIPIQSNGYLSCSNIKGINLKGIRSIVSIKAVDTEGLIFVSAISDGNQQALLMVDTLLNTENPVLVEFQTTFSNFTNDQEFFDVSSDGRFLLYGSAAACRGLGDFEIFSSHLGDNLAYDHKDDPRTFYPLRSLRNDYMKHFEYNTHKNQRLQGASLMCGEESRIYKPKINEYTVRPCYAPAHADDCVVMFFESELVDEDLSEYNLLVQRLF